MVIGVVVVVMEMVAAVALILLTEIVAPQCLKQMY